MSFFDDVKGVLGIVAPTVATALGGPLAGIAVRTLSERLLGRPDGTEAELRDMIVSASPADLVRLKEIEAQFALEMKQAGVRLEQIAAADRDSARNREIKTGDWTPRVLGVLIIAGFFGLLVMMMFRQVPEGAETVLNIMLGGLAAMTTAVVNYFFGSSAGSARKNDTIENLKKGAA